MIIDTVKTGDALLFSGNSPTGFLLKTFISSRWNHSGIAVRFLNGKISLTEEGDLYVFETNTEKRYDPIRKKYVVGAAYSQLDYVLKKYTAVVCRPLKNILRTKNLARRTEKFADKYLGIPFPKSSTPFISVWLGISLQESNKESMFCSELMTHYYYYCFNDAFKKLTGDNASLQNLFGSNLPLEANLYQPCYYSAIKSKHSSIFTNYETLVYQQNNDSLYIILQPLIIIIFLLILIYMTLPPKIRKK
jgi:hypothetical protein